MASVEIKSSGSKSYNRPSLEAPSLQDSLKCMYLNATSLDNKLDEFRVVIDSYCPQIVAVSETWFKNNSIANVNGYNLFRKDRSDGRRGGGVCLYIDERIDSFELSDAGFNLSKIEQIWAVVYFGKDKYLVGCWTA